MMEDIGIDNIAILRSSSAAADHHHHEAAIAREN
jgi:hypothetical protein